MKKKVSANFLYLQKSNCAIENLPRRTHTITHVYARTHTQIGSTHLSFFPLATQNCKLFFLEVWLETLKFRNTNRLTTQTLVGEIEQEAETTP